MDIHPLRLLYFSPTGTTRKVVQAIAQGLGLNIAEDLDLTLPQTRLGSVSSIQGGVTIIGTPVYTGRVAFEAVLRLRQLQASNALAVVVVVYGNREYEDALLELRNMAMEVGFTPCAGAAFIGEHSFSTDETPIATGRPDNSDVNRGRIFGKMLLNKVTSISALHDCSHLSVPGSFPYRERGPTHATSPETRDALCVRCGKCVEVCPVKAITLHHDGVYTDKNKCLLCCACVKNCPTGARILGDMRLLQFARNLTLSCLQRKEPEFYL